MNKPASVAIRDFSEKMEECINESGLPPIVVEMVMRGYYLQIREMAEKQTIQEEEEYRKEKDGEIEAKK